MTLQQQQTSFVQEQADLETQRAHYDEQQSALTQEQADLQAQRDAFIASQQLLEQEKALLEQQRSDLLAQQAALDEEPVEDAYEETTMVGIPGDITATANFICTGTSRP